jgi:hypothetical protein
MNNSAFNRPWTPGTVRLSALRITSSFQRPIDEKKVDRILRGFDPNKVNIVKVCRFPNGLLAVADGQHTVTALSRKFGDILIDCEVRDVLDNAEFLTAVKDCNSPINTKITGNDVFWMDYVNGDPTAKAIHLAADAYGYAIVRKKTNANQIDCVASILRIHRESGLPALRAVLEFARETFDGVKLNNYHVEGIYLFLKFCSKDRAFRRDRVVTHLKETPFPSIERQVENATKGPGVTKARAFATVLRDSYNDRNGQGSPDIKADIP